MKAVRIRNYGGTDRIMIDTDAERPVPGAEQLLVEVHAVSLNRIDSAIRNGYLKANLPLTMPAVLAGDFAGVVAEVGSDVRGFAQGDEVYGNAGALMRGGGSLAEFIAADPPRLARKPKAADFIQAAALPLAGTSAIQGLEEEIKLRPGQKILIRGGAGGVGHLAVQIAKALGAHVTATASEDDLEFVKSLGADEVIEYADNDAILALSGYDAIFDTAGGEALRTLFPILKEGGVFVSMAGEPDSELAKKHEVRAVGQMTAVNSSQLQRLAELVDAGKVLVHVNKVYELDRAREAFERFESAHPRGKIAVRIR
jgi:NADPH:quinone reductase-like Zn-dependent oxidoreductase